MVWRQAKQLNLAQSQKKFRGKENEREDAASAAVAAERQRDRQSLNEAAQDVQTDRREKKRIFPHSRVYSHYFQSFKNDSVRCHR